jgi:predicted Zn-dependent protease
MMASSKCNRQMSQMSAARVRSWLAVAVLLALVAVTGCNVQPKGEGPGHRQQQLALRSELELQIGREAFQQILRKSRVIRSGPEVDRVRTVGKRIAAVVSIERLMREINLHVRPDQFEWEYSVLDRDEINAFCLPGGKICVFTGLLKVVQNDDQLAAVMSHEVSHALAHHISERIARERSTGSGLLSLSFDRQQELEADHIGVFLMTFAGYDPEQALVFWEEMQRAPERRPRVPEILSDHPSDTHRMRQLKSWIPTALAAKRAYDEGRVVK